VRQSAYSNRTAMPTALLPDFDVMALPVAYFTWITASAPHPELLLCGRLREDRFLVHLHRNRAQRPVIPGRISLRHDHLLR
jgi:hypothetical protein